MLAKNVMTETIITAMGVLTIVLLSTAAILSPILVHCGLQNVIIMIRTIINLIVIILVPHVETGLQLVTKNVMMGEVILTQLQMHVEHHVKMQTVEIVL